MLKYDEKRDYIRMAVDCDISYKLADSDSVKTGRCISLCGAGVSFIAEGSYDSGLAMEVNILPKNDHVPTMTAFIEVVKSIPQKDDSFEVVATIKSLK